MLWLTLDVEILWLTLDVKILFAETTIITVLSSNRFITALDMCINNVVIHCSHATIEISNPMVHAKPH